MRNDYGDKIMSVGYHIYQEFSRSLSFILVILKARAVIRNALSGVRTVFKPVIAKSERVGRKSCYCVCDSGARPCERVN